MTEPTPRMKGLSPMDILIGLAVLSFGVYWLTARAPSAETERSAEVYHSRVLIEKLPLNQDRSLPLDPHGVSMVVEVKAGRVRVASSSCRQQLCVRQGWTGAVHDAIICVPNDIVIQITGAHPGYDAVSR